MLAAYPLPRKFVSLEAMLAGCLLRNFFGAPAYDHFACGEAQGQRGLHEERAVALAERLRPQPK